MYHRPTQPTVTSDSAEDDSDEVIVDESNRDFFLPSSLSSFGLSAISDDQDNTFSRREPRHLTGTAPALVNMHSQETRAYPSDISPMGLPYDADNDQTAAWDEFGADSFPPPPPPLNIMDIDPQEYPSYSNPLRHQLESPHPQSYDVQYTRRPGDSQPPDLFQQIPPPPTPPSTSLQQHHQPQQQQPPIDVFADRIPLDVSRLSPWQRRKPRPHEDATNQTTPFSALGLRWHKDMTYKSKTNTQPKDKESKKNSSERQTSPRAKKLGRQGSSSRSLGKPDIVRGIGEPLPWRPGQREPSSPTFAVQRDPTLPARELSYDCRSGQGRMYVGQGQGEHPDYRPVESTCSSVPDPSSPQILFSVDQGPFPFLKSRSTSSDESHSKRGSTSRVKRKTRKKQKKKSDSLGLRQGQRDQNSPRPGRHFRNQTLPYPQHQYFHPSPRASPTPRLHREENCPDQHVTTQLLFDDPHALPHTDEDNEASNLNMMSFRRYSDAEEMSHSNLYPFEENLPLYQYSAENVRPNNASANRGNPRAGVITSKTNIPPGTVDHSGYNFNSRANQVTKRESLPKNLQDLDISIRDEFEQIRKQYQKKGDASLSVINNNVNRTKHSPKTSKKNSGYHSSSSSNCEGSVPKADQASFRPSPSPSPGFLAFQNPHTQLTDGKVNNAARAAPEVFKEYSLDLDNPPVGKLDRDDEMIRRKRCRKHVCFLLLVMLVVVVAAAVAVLALTLGVDVTKEIISSKTKPKYAVARGNLTLKIVNRNFTSSLLMSNSQTYRDLAEAYTRQLDKLFLRSNLSQVYSGSTVVGFR
ncbi:hypothetical protein ElyMa_002026700 [Elysia marginata]|uniref:SEA domain-containing protein n=1 Tax=Elysia marginata TaxID=1093978 RepID=A0AAV4F5Y0_9GAST|nr:hypothetical protein ElyMa_002026700 [Elysia marginata]